MRRAIPFLLALAALSAGCGGDEPIRDTGAAAGAEPCAGGENLDGVEVTGADGDEATLDFEPPLEAEQSTRKVLTEGDGEPIEDNAVARFHFLFANGRDGTVLQSSYDAEPAEVVFEDSLMAGIYDCLSGVRGGSRVLVAIAPEDGFGADTSTGVLEDDTLLFFADVLDVRVPLERAEGEAVTPDEGLPTVELDDDGAPTISVPDGDPPAELVAQPLIEGTGAEVTAGQTITVHYTGVLWDSGEVFDSSWDTGTPATFTIGTGAVIKGWDEGLVGRTVGSQILLVVPPEQGYPEGSPDGSIPPGQTLVFVVDILDASG